MAGAPEPVLIVGAGRAGLGLAGALVAVGKPVVLLARHPVKAPTGVQVVEDASQWPAALETAGLVLLAVPDDAIEAAAQDLAPHVSPAAIVLHLSGLRDKSALAPLTWRVAALGSFHPLQSLVDPLDAPAHLRGAVAAVEGDGPAVAAGRALAQVLRMQPIELRAEQKAVYHAAAALVSNGAATLAGLAEDLLSAAGIREIPGHRMVGPLLTGTAQNVERLGAGEALTGPIRRGDAATVRTHLETLPPALRPLYVALGRETLRIAREQGLAAELAEAVENVLRAV